MAKQYLLKIPKTHSTHTLMTSVSSRRYAASSTVTDAPVNCLLRLPLPTPVVSGEGLGARHGAPFGAYGPLACGGADGNGKRAQNVEVVMVGCYKHDAATETYSGALRVATAPSSDFFFSGLDDDPS